MSEEKKVFNFSDKRKETIEKKRRQFERVVFEEFLGVYSVIDDDGSSYPVKLIDVSYEGCQFQIPFSAKAKNQYKAGQDLDLKFYFTKGSYLPVVVKLKHIQEYIDKDGVAYLRIGGVFDSTLPSFNAIRKFIDFIYQYAEFSCIDKGERKVFFL
jgi:uncharacterized ubiquitin-like protein YukD